MGQDLTVRSSLNKDQLQNRIRAKFEFDKGQFSLRDRFISKLSFD